MKIDNRFCAVNCILFLFLINEKCRTSTRCSHKYELNFVTHCCLYFVPDYLRKPKKMSRRIASDNPVRRILFPPSEDDEAKKDNFSNRQKEEFDKELEEKSTTWNYDFKNECPKPGEKPVRWYENQFGQLIGEVSRIENTAEDNPLNDISNPNGVNNSNDFYEPVEVSVVTHKKCEHDATRTPQKKEKDANDEITPVKDDPPRKRVRDVNMNTNTSNGDLTKP